MKHTAILGYLLFIFFTLSCISTQAEVYRWVDAQGKLHFSDKKPRGPADDITKEVMKNNVDESSEEQRKVSKILRKENDADRDYAGREFAEKMNQQIQRCNKLREEYQFLYKRIQFLSPEGKIIDVSEKERSDAAANLATQIRNECKDI
jgi:hypothetical protein